MEKHTTHTQQNLRIIPLGGLGEVGRNMMCLEYERAILIVDMGFRMPEEDMPGVDYIIPNISCLKGREKDIVGAVFTHGHYDHIAAIPHIITKLGNPPLFASGLTKGIMLKRQEDFPSQPKLNITRVEDGSRVKLGPFVVEFFRQNHNIFDNLGLFIQTPLGNIVHTSDFKFENLEIIIRQARGRIIAATFGSLINRIQQVIALSEKYGRHVAVDGYSMKTNVEICKKLGYIKSQRGTLIKPNQLNSYADSKGTLLCTGAQGEGQAVLMRIITGEHKFIRLKKDDTVIFSSSVIPGNERTVQFLKDELYRQNVNVFHYKMMDIHAGGHGQQQELAEMINLMKPRFFMPIHGQYSMLFNHAELAQSQGVPKSNIVMAENGQIINLTQKKIFIENKTVESNYVMVDGLGVGDVGEIVLRDRQTLSKDGMFVVVAIIDSKTGKVRNSPDIISRGFVYLRESKQLLGETRKKVIEIVNKSTGSGGAVNWSYVKDNIRNRIGDFLYAKTKRRPMILPVIIEV